MRSMQDDAVTDATAEETTDIANKLWERWDTGTRAWLEKVGAWRRLERGEEDFDPEIDRRYVALSLGGYIVQGTELDVAAGVDLIGFHLVLDPDDAIDLGKIADEGANALNAAVIGRADMIVRAAGRTEPDGLVSATGGMTVKAYRDVDGDRLHVVARMPIAMAMARADDEADDEPVVQLPPAETAEPEVPITPARDEAPAALVTEAEPAVEVETPGQVEVATGGLTAEELRHGDEPLQVAATTAAPKPKKATAKKAAAPKETDADA